MRIRDVRVGQPLRTHRGFAKVARTWHEPLADFRENAEVVRFRDVWITSHHPVFIGRDLPHGEWQLSWRRCRQAQACRLRS